MPKRRIESVDTLRGLTIAAMLLVNNPGSWRHIWPPLRHADWHGCTPTDLVFPFFVFVVGIAIVLALGPANADPALRRTATRRIVRRTLILFGLGLFLSAWPLMDFGDGVRLHRNLGSIRIPGVLQRIALCYAAAAIAFLYSTQRTRRNLLIVSLLAYWAAIALTPVPGHGPPDLDAKDLNIGAWLDRSLMPGHLWRASKTWDPEGLLSTIPAVCTCLLGVHAGELITAKDQRPGGPLVGLFTGGSLMLLLGWAWDAVLPINKPLWTPSYVLYSAGIAQLILGLLVRVVDQRGGTRWHGPFASFGKNALFAFVLSGLLAKTIGLVRISTPYGTVGLKSWYYERLFAAWLPAELASFVHALLWVLAIGFMLRWLDRRGVILRV